MKWAQYSLLFLLLFFVGCENPAHEAVLEGLDKGIIPTVQDISSDEAFQMINTGDYIIIDIRSPAEYNSGHINNSIIINFYDEDFELELSYLDKDKKYIYYCETGRRSESAKSLFEKDGFLHVFHIKNGMSEWEKSFPVVIK